MRPIKLELVNFFSHSQSSIDFNKFNAALILGMHNNNAEESNGCGKCLDGGTILTNPLTGERIAIKELYENFNDFYVNGLDDDLKLRPAKIKKVIKNEHKNMIKITMQNGNSETVSEDHPILMDNLQCISAKYIKVGNTVAQPRHMGHNAITKMNIGKARLLALYAAEGGLTGYPSIKFTNTDPAIISIAKKDLFKEFGLNIGNNYKETYYTLQQNTKRINDLIYKRLLEIKFDTKSILGKNYNRFVRGDAGLSYDKLNNIDDPIINNLKNIKYANKIIRKFLSDNGLYGKKSINKEIPSILFSTNKKAIGAFLGMFMACDGYIGDVNKKGKTEISFSSGSKLLINGIQHLMLKFGILSTKRYKLIAGKFDSWTLNINTHRPNLIKFYDLVYKDIVGAKKIKLFNIMEKSLNKKPNPNLDIVPNTLYYDEILKSNAFTKPNKILGLNLSRRQLKNSNMSRDKIKRYASILNNNYLRVIGESDIYWGRVKKIEPVGVRETFDIEIDNKTHLYALDGFITHNSSILESIRWVLFYKARHKKQDDVIKRDTSFCRVKFEFEKNNVHYRIVRSRNKIASESEVKLEQWNGNAFESIACDTNTATDNKICELIGFNHEIFVNSVYFKQGDISLFTKSAPGKKKDILKALLRLDKWDHYQKQTKKYINLLNVQIEERNNQFPNISNIDQEIEKYEQLITFTINKIEENNFSYKDKNEKLANKKYELQSIPNDVDNQILNLQKEWVATTSKIVSLSESIEQNKLKIKETEILLEKYKQKNKEFDTIIAEKTNINIDTARNGIILGKSKVKFLKDKIDHLKSDINQGSCDFCLRIIKTSEIKNIKKIRSEKLDELKTEYNNLCQKLKKAEVKFKDLEDKIKKINETQILKSKLETKKVGLSAELNNLIEANNRLDNELEILSVINYEDKIKNLQEKYSDSKTLALKQYISEISSEVDGIKDIIDKSNIDLGTYLSSKEEMFKNKEKQDNLKKELVKLNEDLSVYEKLKSLFGKDGIQSIIIENVTDELENYANDILSRICNEPTSISIKMQRQSENGSWVETFDIEVGIANRQEDFEALSGGEQFRISLALRLALSKILSKRMGGEVGFLLLDEVSSSLDEKGLAMFAGIINKLSSEMKIMIITHDNRLKEHFDDIIMVTKDSSGSRAFI